jgi:hypothetical protein
MKERNYGKDKETVMEQKDDSPESPLHSFIHCLLYFLTVLFSGAFYCINSSGTKEPPTK